MDEASQALVKFTFGPDLAHSVATEVLVTKPGAVTTGFQIQRAIYNFAGLKTLCRRLSG